MIEAIDNVVSGALGDEPGVHRTAQSFAAHLPLICRLFAAHFPLPGFLKYLKNSELESSTSTSLRLLKVAR
jgi:hypothetical protein